ncbi:MAG: hypothetical protein IT323_09375 [Anaerolineae bacterium]|nr:hypothetical protein [Anaerolineae bacterium]
MNGIPGARASRESLVVMLVAFALALPAAAAVDHAPILSDYAASLRAGNGLVFNPGERVLILFAPLPMLLLAVSPPGVLMAIAAALAAGSLYRIVRRHGDTAFWAGVGALLIALSLPLWHSERTAMPLLTAFSLIGLELALLRRWSAAGVACALAALCGPEALAGGVVILLFAAGKGGAPRFALGWLAPLLTALIGLIAYFGADFWEGLLRFRLVLPTQPSGQAALLFLLAVLLLAAERWQMALRRTGDWEPRDAVLLGFAWAAFVALIVLLTDGLNSAWRFAPAAVTAMLVVWLGWRSLPTRRVALGGIAVLASAAFLVTDLRATDSLNAILLPGGAQSLALESSVLTPLIRKSPDQSLIALDGALQPELRRMVERGDRRSVLVRYAPDVIGLGLYGDVWTEESAFAPLGYAPLAWESSPFTDVWRRTVPIGPFEDHALDAAFGPDVSLTGVALDRANARPGGFFRLRLDWNLARPAARSLFAEARLAGGDTLFTLQRDEIEPSVLRAGPWSTYHAIGIPADVAPGEYGLDLAVIINNGTAGTARLASVSIE